MAKLEAIIAQYHVIISSILKTDVAAMEFTAIKLLKNTCV